MDRKNVIEFVYDSERMLRDEYDEVDKVCFFNSMKVLKAMHNAKVSEADLYGTTGYGYNDLGRDTLEAVYAECFHGEDALVRHNISLGFSIKGRRMFTPLSRVREYFPSLSMIMVSP